MIRNDEGLTKTYNRFHDPDDRSDDIIRLRELHAAMDRAVLDAYGWTDVDPTCEFLLDYEEDEESNKKKPWRYRWPDAVRDEVLARLLDLNRRRGAAGRRRRADQATAPSGRTAHTLRPLVLQVGQWTPSSPTEAAIRFRPAARQVARRIARARMSLMSDWCGTPRCSTRAFKRASTSRSTRTEIAVRAARPSGGRPTRGSARTDDA